MRTDFHQLVAAAEEVVNHTLAALPDELRDAARKLPVSYEDQPDAGLIAEGIDPGTLGLFTGPNHVEHASALDPFPPQITLFVDNLFLFAGYDPGLYREETRTTYLHELGHYLGLNEDELTDRGLE